jgi:transposase
VYYFVGMMPVYQHPEADIQSFRFFTSQIIVNGNATQSEIVKVFGVSAISVKRWVKKYRNEGGKGFF